MPIPQFAALHARPLVLLALLACCGPAGAGNLELQVAAWDHDVSGESSDDFGRADFDQLAVDGKTEPYLRLRWLQDDGAWWPDLALGYNPIRASGSGQTQGPVTIGGLDLAPGTVTDTRADVDDYAATASWPLIRRGVEFDAGLTVRHLRGDVLIRDAASQAASEQPVRQTFPQLASSLRLPLGRVGLVVQGCWIERGHDTAYEIYAGADLRVWRGLSVEAGWMRKRYDVTESDYRLDATLDGLRAGLSYRFD